MWIVAQKDNIGRYYFQSSHERKSEIFNLKANEDVFTANSVEFFNNEIEGYNQNIVKRLLAMPLDHKSKQHTVKKEPNAIQINEANISEEGLALAKEYLNDKAEHLLGRLIVVHNKEEWSTYIFCCGSQKPTMDLLLEELKLRNVL
ncbi:MAG: hypothetical protein ABI851_12155 [Saprospiraceae bacterium]